MANRGARIEFLQAGYDYRDGAMNWPACDNVTFAVEPGDSVALIGPSGCGKSTMLHLAVGIISPTRGSVLVDGVSVDRPRRETAFIPQDLGLLPWKTVLGNAMLPLVLRHVPTAQAREKACDALGRVGLSGRENSWPRELSGGQRQRLALARALATDANLLLMDEPLSAVDALLRESLQDLLLDLWNTRGHTQMFVTHSIEEAVFLGRRILVYGAAPGTLIASVDNPSVGNREWRNDPGFSTKCHELRTILAQGDEGPDAVVQDVKERV